MSLRGSIAECIGMATSHDEAARLICAFLYDIGLAEPGNGWFDDDPEMEEDMGRAHAAYLAGRRKNKNG